MDLIPLTSVPNQSIAFNVDGAYWQIHIYQAVNHMCADVTRNGVGIVNAIRCFGGMPLMPYAYMYAPDFGNFIFDKDADWTEFGAACKLYYLTAEEFGQFDALMFTGTN